jgi:hypothetical protein
VSVRNLASRLTGGTQCEDVEKQFLGGKFATTVRDDIETENKRKSHLFLVTKYYGDDKIKGSKFGDTIWGRRGILNKKNCI